MRLTTPVFNTRERHKQLADRDSSELLETVTAVAPLNPPDLQLPSSDEAKTGAPSKAKRWRRIFLFALLGLVLAGAVYWLKKGTWRFTLSILERRVEAGQPVYICEFANNTTSSIIYLGPFARPAASLRGNPPSGVPSNGNWQNLEPGQKVRLSANVTTADGKPFDGRAAVAMVVIEMPAAMQVPSGLHGWVPADWHLAKSVLIVTEPKVP